MRCSFCGTNIKIGVGKVFVKNDGTIYYWCSGKCEKNQMMGRGKAKLKWTRNKK